MLTMMGGLLGWLSQRTQPAPGRSMAEFLLSDAEVTAYIDRGYHLVTPGVSPALLDAICQGADALHGRAAPPSLTRTATLKGNSNDLFRQIPEFDELLRAPEIQGALTSLVGERCRLEVHRASHYLKAGRGGQQFHRQSHALSQQPPSRPAPTAAANTRAVVPSHSQRTGSSAASAADGIATTAAGTFLAKSSASCEKTHRIPPQYGMILRDISERYF